MNSKQLMSRLLTALCASTLLLGAPAYAAYPTKQIEVIVPYSPGGGTDLVTRAFAETAKKFLPKPMGVVNKTGGAGAVGQIGRAHV